MRLIFDMLASKFYYQLQMSQAIFLLTLNFELVDSRIYLSTAARRVGVNMRAAVTDRPTVIRHHHYHRHHHNDYH